MYAGELFEFEKGVLKRQDVGQERRREVGVVGRRAGGSRGEVGVKEEE